MTELSGQARRPFRAGENAIYCERGAATMTAGPLQCVVRRHSKLILRDVERAMEYAKNVDVSIGLDEICNSVMPEQEDANVPLRM
jgi:hypothetical protein